MRKRWLFSWTSTSRYPRLLTRGGSSLRVAKNVRASPLDRTVRKSTRANSSATRSATISDSSGSRKRNTARGFTRRSALAGLRRHSCHRSRAAATNARPLASHAARTRMTPAARATTRNSGSMMRVASARHALVLRVHSAHAGTGCKAPSLGRPRPRQLVEAAGLRVVDQHLVRAALQVDASGPRQRAVLARVVDDARAVDRDGGAVIRRRGERVGAGAGDHEIPGPARAKPLGRRSLPGARDRGRRRVAVHSGMTLCAACRIGDVFCTESGVPLQSGASKHDGCEDRNRRQDQ